MVSPTVYTKSGSHRLLAELTLDSVPSIFVIDKTLAFEHLHFFPVAEERSASSAISSSTIKSPLTRLNPIKEPFSGQFIG